MSVSFGSAGAWMLVLLVVSTVYSGLAVWLLLLGIASVFACVGMASGIFTVDILAAVTFGAERIVSVGGATGEFETTA